MPYNGSGVYSLPGAYLATAGTTILAAQHNTPLEDIKSALDLAFLRDGRAAMTGPLTLFANGSAALHATTKQQVDALLAAINGPTYQSRTEAAAATISAPIMTIYLAGYAAYGDKGAARYKRVADTGTLLAYQFRTNSNGVRWQLDEVTPNQYQFGAVGNFAANDGPAFQAYLNYCSDVKAVFSAAPGDHLIAATLVARPGPSPDPDYHAYERGPTWRFDNNCVLKASASMDAILQLGDHTYENIIRNGLLVGGTFDQNNLALRGVWATFCNDCNVVDTQEYNIPAYGCGIQFGTSTGNEFYATRTGDGSTTVFTTGVVYGHAEFVTVTVNGTPTAITWVDMSNPNKALHTFSFASAPPNGVVIRVYFADAGYAGFAFNNRIIGTTVSPLIPARAGTTGVRYVNISDNQTRENAISGVLFGVAADFYSGWDGKHFGNHFWNWSPNGPMTAGFDLYGDNFLSGNQHDGPFLYAASFKGPRNHVTGAKANYGGQDADVDAVAALFILQQDATHGVSGEVTVTNSGFKGTAAKRIAAEVSLGSGVAASAYRKDATNRYANVATVSPVNLGVTAWADVSISGGVATVVASEGITSVVRNAAGDIWVTFSSSIGSTPRIFVEEQFTGGGASYNAVESRDNRTTTFARFLIYNDAGALADPQGLSITVFG